MRIKATKGEKKGEGGEERGGSFTELEPAMRSLQQPNYIRIY